MNTVTQTRTMNDLLQQQQIMRLLQPNKHAYFAPNYNRLCYQKPANNPNMMVPNQNMTVQNQDMTVQDQNIMAQHQSNMVHNQNMNAVYMTRVNITNRIFMFFRSVNFPEETSRTIGDVFTIEKSLALARKMENILFKSATSLETYSDISTLVRRIKALLKLVRSSVNNKVEQKNKQKKHLSRTKSSFNVERRRKMLRSKLGDDLYGEMIDLVNEVRRIRRTSNLWMLAINSCEVKDFSHRICQSILPPALNAIYFETRLVDAESLLGVNKTSADPKLLEAYDWDELIKEARSNVKAFRELVTDYASKVGDNRNKNTEKTGIESNDHTSCKAWKEYVDEGMKDMVEEKSIADRGSEEEKECMDETMEETENHSNYHEKSNSNGFEEEKNFSYETMREAEVQSNNVAPGKIEKECNGDGTKELQLNVDARQEQEEDCKNKEISETDIKTNNQTLKEVEKDYLDENKDKEMQSNVNEKNNSSCETMREAEVQSNDVALGEVEKECNDEGEKEVQLNVDGRQEHKEDCKNKEISETDVQTNNGTLEEVEKDCLDENNKDKEMQSNVNEKNSCLRETLREAEIQSTELALGKVKKESNEKGTKEVQFNVDARQEQEEDCKNKEISETDAQTNNQTLKEVKNECLGENNKDKEMQSIVNECQKKMDKLPKMNAYFDEKKDNMNNTIKASSGCAA